MGECVAGTVAIVIVTFNSVDWVPRCVTAARRAAPDATVVVVDNASGDGSAALAGALGCHVIQLERNTGFAAACNAGARAVDTDWIVFANPDLEIQTLDLGGVGNGVAAVAGMIDRFGAGHKAGVRADTGLVVDFCDEVLLRALPRALALRLKVTHRQWSWATGALLAVRASAFEAIGGFDERFFLYYEDRDLCKRLRLSGFALDVCAELRGWHAVSVSSSVGSAPSEAYSLAGWIEYESCRCGPRALMVVALTALGVIRVAAFGLQALGRFGVARAAERGDELRQVLGLLGDRNFLQPTPAAYPSARRALIRRRR